MGELESEYVIHDGIHLHIRPLKASDERAWLDFVNGLSPDSSYHRFFQVLKDFTHRDIGHYLDIDPKKRMAIIAATEGKIVAVARYERIPDTKIGEFAIVVADEYQDKGIGTYLLSRLSKYAKSSGIEEFVAEVLPDNERMLELFNKSGLRMESELDSGIRFVKLFFQ
jgi:RimJ/RimL family protein N-acetyltransferase